MKYFWPIYFAVAVAGSAGIYVYAPKLGLSPRPAAEDRTAKNDAIAPAVSPLSPALHTRAEKKESGTKEEPELPPLMAGIALARKGDTVSWGVTKQETTLYSAHGANSGTLPAGTFCRLFSTRSTSRGEMMECFTWSENGNLRPAVTSLVSRTSLVLLTGDPARLTENQRSILHAYYALAGRIAKRRTELLLKSARQNPFFTASAAAYKKYTSYIEESRQTIRKRDRATGDERMRLDTSLHERKLREGVLSGEYNAVHEKFKEWKKNHPESAIDPEKDSQIQALRKEMTGMIRLIPGLAI